MEPLVAVGRARNTETKGVYYFYAWIKRHVEAKDKLTKLLAEKEELTAVWVCKWRDVPSKYTLVSGDETPENASPNFDMAEDLRKKFLHKKGDPRNKPCRRMAQQIIEELSRRTEKQETVVGPHLPVLVAQPVVEGKPLYRLFTTKEAPPNA